MLYVATAEARPDDPSMHERIRRHRDRRPPHWSTLECPLHLAKRISVMFPAFFSRAAASISPEQPPESGVGSSPKDTGKPPRKGRQSDRLRNAVGVEHTVRPAGTGGSDGLRNRRTHGSKRAARPDGTLKLPMDSGIQEETGLGGIASGPDQPYYCDGLGLANQLIAASARKVFSRRRRMLVGTGRIENGQRPYRNSPTATGTKRSAPHLPSTSGPTE